MLPEPGCWRSMSASLYLMVMDVVIGLRLSEDQEIKSLDPSQRSEEATCSASKNQTRAAHARWLGARPDVGGCPS